MSRQASDGEGPLFSRRIDMRRLNRRGSHPFSEIATPGECHRIALHLDATEIGKLAVEGALTPTGPEGWALDMRLKATVVQPCVVTLAPVVTRLNERVRRVFLPAESEPSEIEVTLEEDDVEPLEPVIDVGAVAIEALSLALPDYPRADDASFTEPDPAPPEEPAKVHPFAALGALKDRLENDD
ncbi:MAG: YceD family protein [Rubricella sp.]